MRKRLVTIEGSLKEQFPPIELYGDTMIQLMHGLFHNYPEFQMKFFELNEWVVLVKHTGSDEENYLDQTMFDGQLELGDYDEVILTPRIEGSFFLVPLILAAMSAIGSAGAAAAGAALGTVAAGAGSMAGFGAVAGALGTVGAIAVYAGSAVMVLGAMYGLQKAFAPSMPKVNNPSAVSGGESPSFIYNTPPNVTEAGNPIPLAYGKCRIGTTVISAGLHTNKTG